MAASIRITALVPVIGRGPLLGGGAGRFETPVVPVA
jgi:hypothetical protein